MPPPKSNDRDRKKQAKIERTLQGLQTKMNYICQMNHNMHAPKGADGTSSVLLRFKRYVDNNRAITAVFMLFLNIGSRYINLNITTSQEYYLRKILVPEFLIFCVSWMGSRDILIAACITFVYSIMTRIFFNENSNFCIVKHKMKQIKQLIDTNDDQKISDKELENAIHVLSKAKERTALSVAGPPPPFQHHDRSGPQGHASSSSGSEPIVESPDDHLGMLAPPIVGGGSYGLDYNLGVENEMSAFGNDPIFEPMQGGASVASFSSSHPMTQIESFTNLPSV